MMSQLVFKLAFEGQTVTAQKVYNAVPIAEDWTYQQILGELSRNGIGMDFRVLSGCLAALVRGGLVRESAKGQFRRQPVRPANVKPEPTQQEPEPMKEQVMTTKTGAPEQSPMDILTELATRAAKVATMAHALVADIENAALVVQDKFETTDGELKKLRQLKALLKDLG